MRDIHRRLMDVVAPAANLTEGAELLGEEAVRLKGRDDGHRRVELLPRVHGPAVAQYAALGFEQSGPASHDPMLAYLRLPEGWERRRSDHHLYDYLVDGNGANRVMVMYKASEYDRDAWMRVL
jgi:hypothetical protein